MKELQELRQELDLMDRQLVTLLEDRMEIARQVAEWKLRHDMPVLDASREEAVLDSRAAMLRDPALAEDTRRIFREIMAMSRGVQERYIREGKAQ